MSQALILNPTFSFALTLRRKLSLNVFRIIILLSIVVLLIYYIVQVNGMIHKAYLIQNYEETSNKLSQENEALKINSSQLNSLDNIEDLIKELGFEKVNRVDYIQVLEGSVVKK